MTIAANNCADNAVRKISLGRSSFFKLRSLVRETRKGPSIVGLVEIRVDRLKACGDGSCFAWSLDEPLDDGSDLLKGKRIRGIVQAGFDSLKWTYPTNVVPFGQVNILASV